MSLYLSNAEGNDISSVGNVSVELCMIEITDDSSFPCNDIHIRTEKGTGNWPQNITEHHVFQEENITVYAGTPLGNHPDLHIFRLASLTSVR